MVQVKRTICLCMIVKNEAHVIRRCLASVRALIDHWVVVDTGSTDGTQALVAEALSAVPGRVVARPWVDFAHNRTEALGIARPHGDYSLIIDADDELVVPEDFELPALRHDSYTLDIEYGATRYQRPQLVRNALPWRYRGVLHEFLDCPAASHPGHLPIVMRINHEGARSTDKDTYHRDAKILSEALRDEKDPFLVARYTFYLAQSYKDCGQYREAIAYYLRRASYGFWVEEIYVSLLQAGRLMEILGLGLKQVVPVYRRAASVCPGRAEALHAMSRLYRINDRFEEGFTVAASGLDLPSPASGLFVEPWIYRYGLRDEFAINAYWTDRFRESLSVCIDLLGLTDLPHSDRPRIAANARFALDKIAERSDAPARRES